MTSAMLFMLLPLILVTATAVVTMLMVAIKRRHGVSCIVTVLGLSLALVSLYFVLPSSTQELTPLMKIDGFSVFFSAVILLSAIMIACFSYPYFVNLEDHQDEFYILLSVAVLGALVMVSNSHFITTFLGMETLSVCLYGMVAYPLHRSAAAQYPMEASIKYLVLSALSSGFVLFGIALLYAQTGTLQFTDLGQALTYGIGPVPPVYFVLCCLMIVTGFAFKLSLVPFHLWTPDVYEGAPLPATAFLATVGKIAMAALLMRFISDSALLVNEAIVFVLALIAGASMLFGNLLALLQSNLKRLLSYSSIAHMGYLVIALMTVDRSADSLGVEAVSFYLLAYALMSLGAFGVMMLVSDSEQERDHIGHYQGLFWRNPWLALVMTAMLFSLAGIPLTIGFLGKFYIFAAGVQGAQWALLFTMVVGSGVGLFYYLRIVYGMLTPLDEDLLLPVAGLKELLPHCLLFLLLALLLLLGIVPGVLMQWLAQMASAL